MNETITPHHRQPLIFDTSMQREGSVGIGHGMVTCSQERHNHQLDGMFAQRCAVWNSPCSLTPALAPSPRSAVIWGDRSTAFVQFDDSPPPCARISAPKTKQSSCSFPSASPWVERRGVDIHSTGALGFRKHQKGGTGAGERERTGLGSTAHPLLSFFAAFSRFSGAAGFGGDSDPPSFCNGRPEDSNLAEVRETAGAERKRERVQPRVGAAHNMPRRYNDAIYKDSVGALLQQNPPGIGGKHDRRYVLYLGRRRRMDLVVCSSRATSRTSVLSSPCPAGSGTFLTTSHDVFM